MGWAKAQPYTWRWYDPYGPRREESDDTPPPSAPADFLPPCKGAVRS